LRLALDKPAWRPHAVTDKIGGEIFCHLLHDRSRTLAHAIDDRIGQSRQRHLGRIDHVALLVPFCGNRFRQGEHRRRQKTARRRAHRLVVEPDGVAAAFRSRRSPLIETLAQDRPRGAACSLHWVVLCGIFEQFAHTISSLSEQVRAA